ncbi:hypothetical protein LJR098_002011 [Rhizobium sp. LjRoot98]|uniref:hypothetical protein n=1 Tax=unclassified Rhizobium TaxID=2613769 RepID=UPI0012E3ABD4|nr:hypothetical protein [Rhizobium sp. Root1204]
MSYLDRPEKSPMFGNAGFALGALAVSCPTASAATAIMVLAIPASVPWSAFLPLASGATALLGAVFTILALLRSTWSDHARHSDLSSRVSVLEAEHKELLKVPFPKLISTVVISKIPGKPVMKIARIPNDGVSIDIRRKAS